MEQIKKIIDDGKIDKQEFINQITSFAEELKNNLIQTAEAGIGVSILMHNSNGLDEYGGEVTLGTHYSLFVPNLNLFSNKPSEYFNLHVNYAGKILGEDNVLIEVNIFDDQGNLMLNRKNISICQCDFQEIQNNMIYDNQFYSQKIDGPTFYAKLKPEQIVGYENFPIAADQPSGFGYDFKTMQFRIEGYL
jgi:hypothetical protein